MRMAGRLSVTLMMAMIGGAIGIAQSDPAQAQIRARIQAYDTAIKPELFTQDAVFWTGAYAHPHRMNEPQAQVEVDNIIAPGRKNSKNVTTVDRITVNGDMAFEYSTFVLTYDDNEGHHTRNGAVLRTWQRQGGVWKIAAQLQRVLCENPADGGSQGDTRLSTRSEEAFAQCFSPVCTQMPIGTS